MPAKRNNKQLAQKIIRALRKDPKKTAVLTILVAAQGIMLCRTVMKNRETPANAATRYQVDVSDNTSPDAASEQVTAPDRWRGPEIPPLSRNLFAVKLDNFPLDGTAAQAAAPTSGNGFWDQLAKSMSLRADQKKERAALLENLEHQASQLKLQSIVMGAKPSAVINGKLVGEGSEVVASGSEQGGATTFRVLKIEPRRVIVEREGVKLEIAMN
jgi:hypothetical protein